MKNEPHEKHRQRLHGPKKIRLHLEKLECRRLLAGLNVSVTIDTSLSGSLQSDFDIPAANRILYVDLNRNGFADPIEPVAITNENGLAFFEGLEAGDYSIGLLTDNYHQRQVAPAVVEQTEALAVPLPSRWLIGGTATGQSLWGLSSDGILTRVTGGSEGQDGSNFNQINISILEIGGRPDSVVQRNATEAWISYRTASQSRLAVFNTVTRQLTAYHVSGSARLVDLATDGQSMFGVVKEVSQADVVRLEVSSQGLSITELASGQLNEVEKLGNNLLVIRNTGGNSFLDLLDITGKSVSSVPLPNSAVELRVDALTSSAVVATSEGAMVFRAINNQLAKVALIAEAAAPLALSSGRLIAKDRSLRGELTVWNMSSWSPVGHFNVGDVDIRDIHSNGLEALVLSDEYVHTLDLAVAKPFQLTLDSDDVTDISFSVHQLASKSAPSVENPSVRTVQENQSENIDLRQIVTDASGQLLWFSVLTGPLHGTVQLTHNGLLEFTPASDFFGADSVKIRVHDGISSADVLLNWNIVEANRPPVAFHVNVDEIPEGLPAGSAIGTVSIVDPNTNESYTITSADHRFRVENGIVYLNEPLNFEAGSSIVLDLTAIDSLGQFSISSSTLIRLTNVVEAPEGVVLTELSIPENTSQVAVGKLLVVSPDSAGAYEITIDDSRFAVQGNELWLLEPLNYEQSNSIKLSFIVKDENHPQLVVNTPINLAVTNQDDKPTEIVLNSREVSEQTAGAEVGLIAVADEDGDVYQYRVSDPRFVVANGMLRLNDSSVLDRSREPTIPLTVTATSASGSIIVFTFPLTVMPPVSPWQNPSNPVDVNGDGIITASDALYVINFLNEHGPGQVPESEPGGSGENPIFPDVNGDGRISPVDALIIINELNDRAAGSGESEGDNRLSGEGEGSLGNVPVQVVVWSTEEERRKNNSRIDAELELLLDQLASDMM